MLRADLRSFCYFFWGRKKPINRKHINIFLMALAGRSSQGRTPTRPRFQTGQNGDLSVEFNRKRPVCPRDRPQFVPGMGSRLSQGRFLFVPDTVPPEMFMFIGFFLPDFLREPGYVCTHQKNIDPPPPPPFLSPPLSPPPSPSFRFLGRNFIRSEEPA